MQWPNSVTRWLSNYFNIWPFRTINIYPKEWNICKTRLFTFSQILHSYSRKGEMPNSYSRKGEMPKWRNFAKSGHTVADVIYKSIKYVSIKWVSTIFCFKKFLNSFFSVAASKFNRTKLFASHRRRQCDQMLEFKVAKFFPKADQKLAMAVFPQKWWLSK